jgi:hypothetical protein
MRWNRPSRVMPAQRHPAASRGGDPVVSGIHVFLCGRSARKGVDGRDKPGHDSG